MFENVVAAARLLTIAAGLCELSLSIVGTMGMQWSSWALRASITYIF